MNEMLLPEFAVSTQGLVKDYGKSGGAAVKALDHIDLNVPRGSIFALLGPNGAGKSTFINILAQLVRKSAGKVSVWGTDLDTSPRQVAAAIGVVPQELNIDPFFTPRQLLDLQAGLYGVPKAERRTDELLAAMSLMDKANAYTRRLSGGMRRRLMVAKAMVHQPPVLVLDEPTAGVDVELRQQLWSYIRSLNQKGVTILLTTHYLEEAQELCDWIAIIDHGKVIACDPKPKMLARLDSKEMIITLDKTIRQIPKIEKGFEAEILHERQILIRYQPSMAEVGKILSSLNEAGFSIQDISTREADLEDVFLRLTSRPR